MINLAHVRMGGRTYVRASSGSQERCVAALTEDDLKSLAAVGELRFGTLCAGRVHARVAAFLGVHGLYCDGTYERASACTYALARTCAPSPPIAVRTARTYVRRHSHGVTNRLSPEPRPVMMTRPVGLQAYAAYVRTYLCGIVVGSFLINSTNYAAYPDPSRPGT